MRRHYLRSDPFGLFDGDDGMSTTEYAIGTIAAAAFAAVLYVIVTGDGIVDALTGLVRDALDFKR
ncbi:DUF4244 domain-containing protein [Amycolatopsis sp. CA-230715]|uniref:DUF4244 domain-containing protein n=1 Tax=Amycolatopsis sp. CA-230715 TaxID=2745196 RepID=UPI001C326284|nr:DUF4244 domain-containing protein [Amycolatopsis sp. CA-230715]QWF81405.1 hypothetical protein HUW46_04836 [Amycolatopsis sp. CA-230715]